MWKVDVSVESNGIVFFDPTVVRAYYGEALEPGENLFRRFTTSDEGDAVLAGGVFVPILAIDDLGYDVVVRLEEEASTLPPEWILSTNEHYALRVDDRLVVADLESIMEWDEGKFGHVIGAAPTDAPFPKGRYAVSVRVFAAPALASAGYELVLSPRAELPVVTADTGASMRVIAGTPRT